MKNPATYLTLLIGLVVGYATGSHFGSREVYHRDHVQAKAGVFIDGFDRNKIYRLAPAVVASDD